MSLNKSHWVALLASPALVGCNLFTVKLDLDLTIDASEPFVFQMGPFDPECDSPKEEVDDGDGISHTVETQIGGTDCLIAVTGEIPSIDMTELRGLIDDEIIEAGRDPDDVTITLEEGTAITFKDIVLVDGENVAATPPEMKSWAATFDLNGEPLADFAGTDTSDFLAKVSTFELTENQRIELNELLIDPATVFVAGTADIAADLETSYAQLAEIDGPKLEFTYEMKLVATAKVPLF